MSDSVGDDLWYGKFESYATEPIASASRRVSGAISAPLGQSTVPPSMKNVLKHSLSLYGSKIMTRLFDWAFA